MSAPYLQIIGSEKMDDLVFLFLIPLWTGGNYHRQPMMGALSRCRAVKLLV